MPHRLAAGLTCERLGAKIGVVESSITHYETGRCVPPPETLSRLAKVLAMPHQQDEAGGKASGKGKGRRAKRG
ncbi:MAG TPA: helix-turn-helix transcriptional regulator [Gemmataceae bacterium]|nr:helix-turn-helix transcriptional regulator [Gemmataceae bacterium]